MQVAVARWVIQVFQDEKKSFVEIAPGLRQTAVNDPLSLQNALCDLEPPPLPPRQWPTRPRPLGIYPTTSNLEYIIIYLPRCIWSVAWVNALFSAVLSATAGIPGAPNSFRPGEHSEAGAAPPKRGGGELGTREVQKPCWVNGIYPRENGIYPRVCVWGGGLVLDSFGLVLARLASFG